MYVLNSLSRINMIKIKKYGHVCEDKIKMGNKNYPWTAFFISGQGLIAECCEQCNELSANVKCAGLLV